MDEIIHAIADFFEKFHHLSQFDLVIRFETSTSHENHLVFGQILKIKINILLMAFQFYRNCIRALDYQEKC